MSEYEKSVLLYDDGIGRVDYISHMGSDLTVVNSARVSFGVEKLHLDNRDRKLISTSLNIDTLLLWSIVLLPTNLLSLYLFARSTTDIELGPTMKSLVDIPIKIYNFMSRKNQNTAQIKQTKRLQPR